MRHPSISEHTESVLRRSVEAAKRRSYQFDPYCALLSVDTEEYEGTSNLLIDFWKYWRLYSSYLGLCCFVLIVAPREWWKAAKAEGHRYIYEAAREYAQLTEEQAKALFAFDGWPIEFQAAMAESMYNSPHIKVLSRRVEYFLANGK